MTHIQFFVNTALLFISLMCVGGFLSIPLPNNKKLHNYKISLRLFAVVDLFTALTTFSVLMADVPDYSNVNLLQLYITLFSMIPILIHVTHFALIILIKPDFNPPYYWKKLIYPS